MSIDLLDLFHFIPWGHRETNCQLLKVIGVKIIYIYLQSFVASISIDRINGVMVSMLVSTGVDRGFKPQSGQTTDYEIVICCFSAKHAALRSKSKD